MTCAYCSQPCRGTFSPGDDKAQRFPACSRLHAIYALNVPLILGCWK